MAGKSQRQQKIDNLTGRKVAFNTEALNMLQNSTVKLVVDRWEGTRVARRHFSVFDQLATNGKTVGTVVYPPTLTKNEAVAGNNMFALYAAWKGMAGAQDDDDIGYVQCGRSEPELLTDRMKICGEEWAFITTGRRVKEGVVRQVRKGMSPDNVRLLTAICHDMLISDGTMIYTEKALVENEAGEVSPEMQPITLTRRAEPYEWGDKKGSVTFEVERAVEPKLRPIVRWRKVVEAVCGIRDRDCQREAVKRMCVDLDSVVTN